MAKHNETGLKGEQIAEKFLLDQGYEILERNWRFQKAEVDCIAHLNGTLVIAEIKTRSSFDFGFPEESVTAHKQNMLKLAAEAYISINPRFETIRFDIISVLIQAGKCVEVTHIEDAFF